MLKKPKLVLIDLDGTLVDTAPDLACSVNTMLVQLGLPACSERDVRTWIGNGAERLVRRALIGKMDGEPEEALFQRAFPVFMRLYADNLCNRSHLFAGVRDGLDYLKAAGYKVGCITNKPAQFTDPLLKQLGVYDEFDIVISGDTLPKKKPDPMPLLHAAAHFRIDPHDALMVGDSISDVTAARAAGFHIVCVNYGYNHGHDVGEAHPDAVIASLAHLQGLLERAA